MALDRQDIEKRDFPIGRRGYEPDAVDAHLRRIADEVVALRAEQSTGPAPAAAPLADAASDHVRLIVQAAEQSAAEIERAARTEAQEQIARVSEATQAMLTRLDAMEAELGTLIDGLRGGAERLGAELRELEGGAVEVRGVVEVVETVEVVEAEAAQDDVDEAALLAVLAETIVEKPEPPAEEPAASAPAAKEPTSSAEEAPNGAGDVESARLIALNLALSGTAREEADRYLAENFQLDDRASLLDDVYDRVG